MRNQLTKTWDFLGQVERAHDPERVADCLLNTARRFGFSTLFAGWVPPLHPIAEPPKIASQIVVQKMPLEWASRYIEKGYAFRDPIVQNLQTERAAFTWSDAYGAARASDDVKLINGEASEFGLREGFVVPITLLDGSILAFSFGGSHIDLDPEDLMGLAFATNFAVGQMLHLSSPLEGSNELTLTCRERDCLQWAAEGKTDWEIALILGISRNTVIKHFQSARAKLDTLNKFQTVAKALRLKIIR